MDFFYILLSKVAFPSSFHHEHMMFACEPFHALDLFHFYFVGKNGLLVPYEARVGVPGIFAFTLISSNFHLRSVIAMPTHWEYCVF